MKYELVKWLSIIFAILDFGLNLKG